MKFALAIFAVLALASPLYALHVPATGSGALAKDLQDFIDIVPLDKLIDLAKRYRDKQFQTVLQILGSPEVKQYVLDVEAAPEMKKLLKFAENLDLDVSKILNAFNKALGLPPSKPLDVSEYKTGGLRGFLDEAIALMPMELIVKLFHTKIEKRTPFAALIQEISKPENHRFILNLHKNPHFQKVTAQAQKAGINVSDFSNTFYALLAVKAFLSHV